MFLYAFLIVSIFPRQCHFVFAIFYLNKHPLSLPAKRQGTDWNQLCIFVMQFQGGSRIALASRTIIWHRYMFLGTGKGTVCYRQSPSLLVGGFNPLKNISQLGWLFPIYRKIKVMFQTTNQLFCPEMVWSCWANPSCRPSEQALRSTFLWWFTPLGARRVILQCYNGNINHYNGKFNHTYWG